ncbi:DUF6731 family protein [Terribacillus saccharophilus]|uniref:DUF6731 family protein n=1 Tax=Terribacillus saccharophilus TaxID=361277 RepID=UPI000C99C766|nr:DUF6731 family protein [Terribacillus goriensis]
MAKSKNVRFDYFKVYSRSFNEEKNVMEDKPANLKDILETASQIEVKKRIIVVGDDVARLQSIDFNNNMYELHFIRIRKNGYPVKAHDDGSIGYFQDVTDEEGFGEEVSALYDPKNHIVMIRRNMFSLSPSAIASFFTSITNVPGYSYYFRPLVHPKALSLMKKDHLVKSAVVNIADIKNAAPQTKATVGKIITKADEIHESVNFSFKISLNPKGSKKKSRIPIYEELMALSQDDNVVGLDVTTKANEDASVEYLDLIEQKLVDFHRFSEKDFDLHFKNVVHKTVISQMHRLYRTRENDLKIYK